MAEALSWGSLWRKQMSQGVGALSTPTRYPVPQWQLPLGQPSRAHNPSGVHAGRRLCPGFLSAPGSGLRGSWKQSEG